MDPAESFRLLNPDRQRQVHLSLCEQALQIWTAYVAERSPIVYTDSVVGMRHEIDVWLPHDALRCARLCADLEGVENRYLEPIVAMQDGDLVFPDSVKIAFCAIYNCFRKHACKDALDPWLIVNQALSSNNNEGTCSQRLTEAITAAS